MKAVTWQGRRDMRVVEVQDPTIEEPTDAVIEVGDRVVVPFNISCGTCWMCGQGLHSQCETTQNSEHAILRLLEGETDHLGVKEFATHHLPLGESPDAYATFRDKGDGMAKVVFTT